MGKAPEPVPVYHEKCRPQFHFTAKTGWLNDPNGLVFYAGEYHLFFQHNPRDTTWGNMTWGHAISKDLVHWEQLPHPIHPDEMGTIFSGSAAVDWRNTAGFQSGPEQTIVAAYTSAGQYVSPPKPFTQSIAYSNDRGRTWTKYEKNPVLANVSGYRDRDPKLLWHEPTGKWVMVLYIDYPNNRSFAFFTSPDLKTWTHTSTIPDFFECPDLFQLPVDGNPENTRWVLMGADGRYLLGDFDGTTFHPRTAKQVLDYRPNFYASQTYNDIPPQDGRCIQIAWMKGGSYPGMPFNQQMAFPCELSLRAVPGGWRLYRNPISELQLLHGQAFKLQDVPLKPGDNPLEGVSGELFDLRFDLYLGDASEIGITVSGEQIVYSVADRTISYLGSSGPLLPQSDRIQLQLLVDRTSVEVFGNDGALSMSACFLPKPDEAGLRLYSVGGEARIMSMEAYRLNSIWLTRR